MLRSEINFSPQRNNQDPASHSLRPWSRQMSPQVTSPLAAWCPPWPHCPCPLPLTHPSALWKCFNQQTPGHPKPLFPMALHLLALDEIQFSPQDFQWAPQELPAYSLTSLLLGIGGGRYAVFVPHYRSSWWTRFLPYATTALRALQALQKPFPPISPFF